MSARLDEIREREKAATPGPWKCEPRDVWLTPERLGRELDQKTALAWDDEQFLQAHVDGPAEVTGRGDFTVKDAWFIAHAREDVRHLLDELDAANRRIAELESGECGSTTK